MATPIKTAMIENTSKEGTNTAILGTHVDTNPNTIADILDGTTATPLGQAGVITVENTSVAAGGVREVLQLGIDPVSGTAADADGGRLTLYVDDDGGNETDIARIDWVLVDASDTTEDGRLDFSVITAGSMASELQLDGASLRPTTSDGLALGDADQMFSDLFLASGGVVNFNNGNVTLTHSAGLLTLLGGGLTVGVDDTGYDVKFFGATSGKSLLWDESADKLIVTGDFSASGTTTLPTGTTVGNLTLASGSITDSGGAISFGNENLTTTGTLSAGATTVTSLLSASNDGGAIGASGTAFSDLFLASGAVVNFAAGDVTITHGSGYLNFSADKIFINDTANTFLTVGLTLQQDGNDDEIMAFKSSDVDHGMTTNLETDTFGTIKKAVATLGGLEMRGATEHSSQALSLFGYTGATTNTAKTTAGYGAIRIVAQEKTGTTVGVVSADGNLCSIDSDGTVRFIFDVEGSAHADVEWVAFDAEDDFQLIKDLEANFVPEIFGEAVKYKDDALVRLGLFGKNSIRIEKNGRKRGMLNTTKLAMLHHGTLNKMVDAFRDMESRLFVAENKLKMLGA